MQIAVIGIGQVGSRHLESLSAAVKPFALHAVEPSIAGQERARILLGTNANKVTFHSSVGSLTKEIDVAVIATGAGVRRDVLIDLLRHSRVRYLVLEKILFQSVADCLWAESFLRLHNVRAWVNFPRRVQPVYIGIHESLVGDQSLDIQVSGTRWGLVTSGVHFLDLVLFLSRSAALAIEEFRVETYPSRHAGCVEGVGVITGVADGRHLFSIRASASGSEPLEVLVKCGDRRWSIVEKDNEALSQYASTMNKWQPVVQTHPLFYQSQLTAAIVDSLLSTDDCGLADYSCALQSHLPFLRAWNRNFAPTADPDNTHCPVT